MTLEADGIIDVWEIETGKVVAQYEGLEVHEDMQSIPDMNRRIAELEATVARLEQDNRRLRWLDSMPLDAMWRHYRFSMYAENVALDAEYTAQQFDSDDEAIRLWLTSREGDA